MRPHLQLLLGSMLPAHAGGGSEAADNGLILISSALVLLMTPGLAFFYGGFVQGRNVLNTMGMSLVMMGIATLVWVSSGVAALVLAGLVGTRRAWPQSARPAHDVTQIILGTGLLWIGWVGSTAAANSPLAGRNCPSLPPTCRRQPAW